MDFDGDTVSIILVPEEDKEETMKVMSPRVNKIYKKNLNNIFEFNHETLNLIWGLQNFNDCWKLYSNNQQTIQSFNDYS